MARHRDPSRSFRVKLPSRADARHRHEQQTALAPVVAVSTEASTPPPLSIVQRIAPPSACDLSLIYHGNPVTERHVQFTARYTEPASAPIAGSALGFEAQLTEASASAAQPSSSVSTLEQPMTFGDPTLDSDRTALEEVALGKQVDNLFTGFSDISWDTPHEAGEDLPEPVTGSSAVIPAELDGALTSAASAPEDPEPGDTESLTFATPVFDEPQAPAPAPIHITIDGADLAVLLPAATTHPITEAEPHAGTIDRTDDASPVGLRSEDAAASDPVTEFTAPSFDEEPPTPAKEPLFVWRGKPIGGGSAASTITTTSTAPAKKQGRKKQQMNSPEAEEVDLRNWVDTRLLQAFRMNASDVHLTLAYRVTGSTDPDDIRLSVRARVDGVMSDMDHIDGEKALAAHRMFKTSADMTTLTQYEPEEKKYKLNIDGELRTCRVAGFNTAGGGSKIVIRLPLSGDVPKLEQLGINEKNLGLLKLMIRSGNKMLIIAGPMGSGKTTTVHASLSDINDGSRVILSLEGPVEREIPGIDQLEVDEKNGAGFATFLPALVRSDYDTFFLGEIRDHATAAAGVRQAKAGRQVVTTMHANNNITALLRLIELAEDSPLSVLDAVLGIASQRLVRKLNPLWDHEDPATKYSGRLPIHEVLVVGPEIVEALMQNATLGELQSIALKTSSSTFAEDAKRLIDTGLTDQAEVDRVLGVTIDGKDLR